MSLDPPAWPPGQRTLVVTVADWPVVAAGVLPTEPAVVVESNRVVALSSAARDAGVRVGLRRREAQARCPEVAVIPAELARDIREFEPVVNAVAVLCPRLEVLCPGVCGVPTQGPSRYFGGDAALGRRVREAVREGLGDREADVTVGVADGWFTAQVAAQATAAGEHVTVVPPAMSAKWLAGFPVGLLEGAEGVVSPELLDLLTRLGLPTLGAVAALPVGDVVARFGPEGVLVHRLASGSDARPPRLSVPAPQMAVEARPEPPLERVDQAAFAARGLAHELGERLAANGLTCSLLLVLAETEHGERLERRWRQGPGTTAAAVVERVRWQLDGWLNGAPATRPTAGITLLRLVPEEVVPAGGTQLALWGSPVVAPEAVVRAVARLEGLLGPEAVTVPQWRGGRHPGDQVTMVPAGAVDLTSGRAGTVPPAAPAAVAPAAAASTGAAALGTTETPPWPGRLPSPSPATVLGETRRLAATVVDAAGAAVRVDGRSVPRAAPAVVTISEGGVGGEGGAGRPRAVVGWAGPWPVAERWWDPAIGRRRARFQVLLDDGMAYLLETEGGRWTVAAVYD